MHKSQMSSRERMLAAIKGTDHDRVPFSPYVSQGTMNFWQAPLSWRNQIERAEQMLELEMDPTIDIWFHDPQPYPEVTIKTWRDTSGPEPLITKEYHTPAGLLRQTVRETSDWYSWRHAGWIPTTFGVEKRDHFGIDLFDDWNVSRRTEPWVKGPEDLEKLKYIIRIPQGHVLDEWCMDAQRAKEIAQKYNVLLVARRTIVGDAFQWFCDIPTFLIWLIEKPGFVTAFFKIFQGWALELTKLALEVGVDVVQRRGWYEIPTYFGVKYWQKYLVPLIDQESELVHQAGKFHSYFLPEGQGVYANTLKDMKCDILQAVDPRMLHGGHLNSLFEQCGSKKAFWGGVNAEVTLLSQDAKQIDKAVKDAIETLDQNNRFILSALLFPEIPQKSIMHMIDSWKKYRDK